MKKLRPFFILTVLVLALSACGNSQFIEGTFVSQDSLISEIQFKNGEVSMVVSLGLDSRTPSFKYQVRNGAIYIKDPEKGDVPFTIVDKDTIHCDVFGLAGTYTRK